MCVNRPQPRSDFDADSVQVDESILMTHLDRTMVSAVNTVGVDINRAVREPYHAFLLPYIAGLGPRKAQRLIQRINAAGGTLLSRAALVTDNIMGQIVFMNASGFLRIDHDDLPSKLLNTPGDAAPDVLDTTRIHPEDYDIARKMAADAEELDEEDLADLTHPSQVVQRLLDGDPRKLDELSLDDFAVELQRLLSVPKRLTLYLIRDELKQPFRESREPLQPLGENQIFTQLTGETAQTLEIGHIIPVVLQRILPMKRLLVRLDSGIEGMIEPGYWADDQMRDVNELYHIGQTLSARVIEIRQREFSVRLDSRPSQLQAGDLNERRIPHDEQHWDLDREQADIVKAETAKKKASGRSLRTIQHPYFHNFSYRQAEEYLSTQPRGECVVRPSSRGVDHLAVTWKVDHDCYQHFGAPRPRV
jgi:transcription elongation factor SPT6